MNSQEFLFWTLIAWVYLFGLGNAWLRRRWRRNYGDLKADNSIANLFYWLLYLMDQNDEENRIRGRNFKRDFSIVNFVFISFPLHAHLIGAKKAFPIKVYQVRRSVCNPDFCLPSDFTQVPGHDGSIWKSGYIHHAGRRPGK